MDANTNIYDMIEREIQPKCVSCAPERSDGLIDAEMEMRINWLVSEIKLSRELNLRESSCRVEKLVWKFYPKGPSLFLFYLFPVAQSVAAFR